MTTWLPRCRTLEKPCDSRMRQTSRPESRRRLGNLDLDAGHEYLAVSPLSKLVGRGRFEEELDRLDEVRACFLDSEALARDVEFGAQRDERILLAFDHGGELSRMSHGVASQDQV